MGTNWYQLSTDRVWRMVASYNGCLWGVETSDLATCKTGADITDIIRESNQLSVLFFLTFNIY